ncbi:MAG: hypothetical protein CMJ64_29880 [Planctomycetaceae bacterium]|nr:hypothetical protein [Planctomycetaceae bacterium]
MAVLRPIRGLESSSALDLKQAPVLLGRNPERCDVVLEHFAVSREHARVEIIDSTFYIEDLKSRNGVRLNGRRITPGVEGRQRLWPGDRIEIAAFEFRFEEEPSTDDMVHLSNDTEKPDILSTLPVGTDSSKQSGRTSKLGKLHILVGIIEDLSSELDFEKVLPKIVSSLLRAFPQSQNGCVLLRNDGEEFVPAAVQRTDGKDTPVQVSRTILDEVVSNRQAILSSDATKDSRFEDSGSNRELKLNSVMSAPLLDRHDVVFGVLQLEVLDGDQPFTAEDLELLSAVATHLAVVIENSRLHDSALREQRTEFETRFRKLVEGSLQGILIHRMFRPLFVNDAWASLHGYTVEEVLAMDSVLPLIAADEHDKAMAFAEARLRGDDVPSRYEGRELRKDGAPIWVEKFVSVIDWDGSPAVQTAVVDLSHRKQADDALRQAHEELEQRVADRTAGLGRSNRDLEQFAYSASHDLQAPLRTIASYCQLLQQRYGEQLDERANEFLSGAIDGVKRMKRLLDDLLRYSRVTTQSHPFQATDCDEVLQDVLRNLKVQIEECKATITNSELPTIYCDSTQLMQLLQNLIGNALAYRADAPPQIQIGVEERPEEWGFSVQDNGIGIDPRHFERIFQIFQRLYAEHERPGSGIGLSLCKRIVERHGGEISVQSTPGRGSTVFFTIPKLSEEWRPGTQG